MIKADGMDMCEAIVIGSKSVNAVGLIRSLGAGHVDVTFMSTYSKIESKYTEEYVRLPDDRKKWLAILKQYGERSKEKAAIFSTDDDTAFWLDENYEALQKYFIVPHAKGKMRTLADKSVMNEIAKKAKLNVPKFAKISLVESERKNEYPIILKPYAGYAGNKGDISICYNENEYRNAVRVLKKQGYKEVLLQQLLDDPEQEEIGLMGMALNNGQVVIPGVIHKIRSYPTGKGSTSYAKFSPVMSEMNEQKIKQFVSATGYVGIFDIEMIKAYGKYWFIEINYRNGQYGYIPTAAGYNLPANWVHGMKNEKVEKCNNLQEIYYINEREDYRHVKEGTINKKEWLKEFHTASAYGMYCPGDQRPFIRQYVKIPDRVIIKGRKLKSHIKDLLIKEEWNIAIRKRGDKSLWEKGGESRKFTVLPNTIRYWAADPFIVSVGEKDYLFFEMFDRLKSKGLIGYREINGNKIGKMKIAYEADHHLSFPYIFEYKNEYYMMPEYSEGKELFVLKATHFPDKWEKIESWMQGKRFVDSVLLSHEGENYLLTQDLQSGYSSEKFSIFIRKGKEWVSHKKSPVTKSLANARLAGKIFFEKNQLIRVAQDCQDGYGTKLHFNHILKLSEKEYEEEMFRTISVQDIIVDSKECFCGIHTYNSDDCYEVIDLKNPDRIRIGNILNILWRIIGKLKK